jgi:hypothetical protein
MLSPDDRLTALRSGGSPWRALASAMTRQARALRTGFYRWLEGIRFRTGMTVLAGLFAIAAAAVTAIGLTAHSGADASLRPALAGREPSADLQRGAAAPAWSAARTAPSGPDRTVAGSPGRSRRDGSAGQAGASASDVTYSGRQPDLARPMAMLADGQWSSAEAGRFFAWWQTIAAQRPALGRTPTRWAPTADWTPSAGWVPPTTSAPSAGWQPAWGQPGRTQPAQYWPAQYWPAQYWPAQYRPAQYSPAQYRPAQYSPAQYWPARGPAWGGRDSRTWGHSYP